MPDVPKAAAAAGSSFTFRAVLIGLVGGTIIAACGYINDSVVGLGSVAGSTLPVMVYGPLLLAVLGLGPALGKIHPVLRLRAGEYAVVIAILLASCGVATCGMMRFFTPMLGLAGKTYSQNEGWKNANLRQYLPQGVMLADGRNEDPAAAEFVSGPPPGTSFGFWNIPWDAWSGPLLAWLPVMAMVMLAGLSMAMLVQRQWSQRERLALPIAEFADTILRGRTSAGRSLFHSPAFWWAAGIVFCIHLVNGLHAWWIDVPEVPLSVSASVAIAQKFPWLGRVWDTYITFNPRIWFTVVGFSFFVSREVSLTLGIAGPLNTIGIAILMSWGINLYASPGASNYMDFLRMGGTIGLAIAVFYHGRAFYRVAFARAFGMGSPGPYGGEGVWPARLLLLASVAMTAMLMGIGIAWPVAILDVLLLLLTFLILMSIAAETGLFFIQSGFVLSDNVSATMGLYAMGPKQTLLSSIFGILSVGDSRVVMSSMALHGLELCDRHKVPSRKIAPWMAFMVMLAVGVALPTILYVTYKNGLSPMDTWAVRDMASGPWQSTMENVTPLKNAGLLEKSAALTDGQRLLAMSPMQGLIPGVLAGIGLTFLLSVLRMRFPAWPIHPIIIPLLGVNQALTFSFSFLVGWILRTVINAFGGGSATQKAKPFMVGLIAGDLLAAVVWMIVGWLYYASTGLRPKPYGVLP